MFVNNQDGVRITSYSHDMTFHRSASAK